MGCGASKTVLVSEPQSTPTHGSYTRVETPVKTVAHPGEPINLLEPDDEIFVTGQGHNDPSDQCPNPDSQDQRMSQRRSSHVTSNDSGLEEDNGGSTEPATRVVSAHSKASEMPDGVDEPDVEALQQPHGGFQADTYPDSEEAVRENPETVNLMTPDSVVASPDNVQHIEAPEAAIQEETEEDFIDLGAVEQPEENVEDEGLDVDMELPAEESSELPPAAEIEQTVETEIANNSESDLVIAGCAIEPSVNDTESSNVAEMPGNSQIVYSVEAESTRPLSSKSNRPFSAQSRAPSAFQRPSSSNSVKFASKSLTIAPSPPPNSDSGSKHESRNSSAKSTRSVKSIQNVAPVEDVEQEKTPSSSRKSSSKSVRSSNITPVRPASTSSNKSIKSASGHVSSTSKSASQQSNHSSIKKAPTPSGSRPGSKTSQSTFNGSQKMGATNSTSRPPSAVSNRTSSKTSQAPIRPDSMLSQRSDASLKVPEIGTSGSNLTNAERSASSLDDLEMLQHVMEGTLENSSRVETGGETESTALLEMGKEKSEEVDGEKEDEKEELYSNDFDAENEKGTPGDLSKENTLSGLEDIDKNKFLDTFSTKNLEESMRPLTETEDAVDEDSSGDKTGSPVRSPQDDQEEHINS